MQIEKRAFPSLLLLSNSKVNVYKIIYHMGNGSNVPVVKCVQTACKLKIPENQQDAGTRIKT